MILLLQGAAAFAVTGGVLMLLARLTSFFGGVGRVELAILLAPSLMAGIWAARRVGRIATARRSA